MLKPKDLLLYSISLAIIAIGLSVAYYFFVYIPRKDKELKAEQTRIELQKTQAKSENEVKLSNCIYQAELSNTKVWNGHCEKLGKEKACLLPLITAESYQKDLENQKDSCFRKYK